MRKLLTVALIAGLAVTVTAKDEPKKSTNTDYKLNLTESTFKWTGKKVTTSHWGHVKFSNATFNIENKKFKGGEFVMDMTTIDNRDMQGEYSDKLVNHLKSDDFFSTAKFPTSTLKTKSVSAIAGAKAGSPNYNIVADLTIKGITKEVSFPAQIIITNDKVIANAEFEIDRTLYDITYKGMADNLIHNNFTVNVRVVANK
ncbi:MAG: YceI family protein [Bacteroidia bacterium]|nr:YceI family protein [Bacteroidia bacterium]MCC7533342.1 YceI family protein [Bacteroidia bacterium]MCZ2140883.1 YceI family protein [Bacteroidia bacterium]